MVPETATSRFSFGIGINGGLIPVAYPFKLGLYSLRMFGRVNTVRTFPSPPILHDTPVLFIRIKTKIILCQGME